MPRPRADGSPPREPERVRLNDRFVKAARPGPRRTLYYDTVQEGFILAVEPSGHKSFKLAYRFGGRPRALHIAGTGKIGLAEARAIARDKMADVVKGVDVQAEKVAARRAGSFEELATRYREEHAKRRNRSWAQADFLVRKYLLPTWAKLAAKDVTRADVRRVFRRLTDDGAPAMANQVLAAASAIFSWALKNEVVDLPANPCHGVERNPTRSRERVLSDAEVSAFWAAFDEAGLVRSRALRMILLTGQRPGEVAHMRREHLEAGEHEFTDSNGRRLKARGAWWSMPGAPDPAIGWPGTKNGQSHRVWLPMAAVALVEELGERKSGFAFAGPRGRAVARLDDAMARVCAKVGVADRATPHDLRRTHGTTVTSLGFTRDQMNRLQNHKEGGIGSVYDRHSYANESRVIQEAVVSRLMSLAEDGADEKVVPLLRG